MRRKSTHPVFVGSLLLLSLLIGTIAMADEPAAPKTLFDASKVTLPAEKKVELATAMGTFVRNGLDLSEPANVDTAKKFLAVALTLDPRNKVAYVADAQLKQGRAPAPIADATIDADAIVTQLTAAVDSLKVSQVEEDRKLTAYFLALVLELKPDHEDAIFELGMLADAGISPQWPAESDTNPISIPEGINGTSTEKQPYASSKNLLDTMVLKGDAIIKKVGDQIVLTSSDQGRLETQQTFQVPVEIIATVATDSTNIRLYFAEKGRLIFNWEVHPDELKFHDLITGDGIGLSGKGNVPAGAPVTIRWIVEQDRARILVNNVERAVFSGSYKEVSGKAGIGTHHKATLTVNSFTVAKPGTTVRKSIEKPTYLGDLPPTNVSTVFNSKWNYFGKGWLGPANGQKLTINGIDTPNGLSAHPQSNGDARISYNLTKKYGRFIGEVAMNDSVTQSRTPITFRILGDGKELWLSRPVQLSKEKQSFDVKVTGIDQLDLIVSCPGDHHDAHAVWVEPRLFRGDVPEEAMVSDESVATPLPVDNNMISRPEFQNTPKPVQKSQSSIKSMMVRVAEDGQMIGSVSDVIATVPPGGGRSGEVRFVGDVGGQMNTSRDEALRAVRLRYPQWAGGTIEISFGEKYDKHDGGSAGSAFAMLILSLLEGIDLDPTIAVTGDITVDWKVRKVGGIAAKLRGAQLDRCTGALIPAENTDAISDMVLLYDGSILWDVQVFSMATLQEGLATVRADRDAKIAEAMKLFSDLKAKRGNAGRAILGTPGTQEALAKILELAPNHLSAKSLLAASKGQLPRTLSSTAALYQFFIACYPYRDLLFKDAGIRRGSLPTTLSVTAKKRIADLRPIAGKSMQPLLTDFMRFVDACDKANLGRGNANDWIGYRNDVISRLVELQADREVMEKLVREGF